MKWLYKLEYKYGRHHIRNLMGFIVGGMVVVYVLQLLLQPFNLIAWLTLDISQVLRGQVWRLVTFLLVPSSGGAVGMLITAYCYYFIGQLLEQTWGSFRFNFYYLVGTLATILAAFAAYFLNLAFFGVATGGADNYALNLSLLLAVATLAPDLEFRLFFFIPIKAKWLGIGYAILMLIGVISSFKLGLAFGVISLVTLVLTLLNYLLFFGQNLIQDIRNAVRVAQNRRNWRRRNR